MRIKHKIPFFVLLLVYTQYVFSSKTENGFKALIIFDYFKAKTLFYKEVSKNPDPYAAYGLATIYSRNNNPFFNLDSASKYGNLSFNYFKLTRIKQNYSGFIIDSASILNLCDTIAAKAFGETRKNNSVSFFDRLIVANYLANKKLILKAIYLRDELEFNKTVAMNKSDSTHEFILTHPESDLLTDAQLFFERQLFDEQTTTQTEQQYLSFIKKYPDNVMLNSAFEYLYNLYKKESNINGLKYFVTNFTQAPQINEAWKLLFSLTVKSFSNSELEKFLNEYPAFPFKNSIVKELELNKFTLYPYQKDDDFGFIDSVGKIIIAPAYDAVSDFSEGLSVANRNDSVFFINKENTNAFNRYFSDAYSFKNGIAAVKQNLTGGKPANKWCFINRQGQIIGATYDEINELSNNVYIVRSNNKYGAVDHYGKTIIEPRFDKLGDFKNEFAYYVEGDKYGFVSKTGYVYKAEFDWISDFNENNIAVIKQSNFYGLINSQGIKILEPQYDLILKAQKNIFIPVKNNLYGFYSGNNCYLTPIIYDFIKEKPAEFYTNGSSLKLLRKNEAALADLNGKINLDFGSYDEIGFVADGLIKAKRKNKYGYIDKKLNPVIPFKYLRALDFCDSLAIVGASGGKAAGDKNTIINTKGKEIFTTEETIEKTGRGYFLVDGEEKDLINSKGEKVFINLKNIQKTNKLIIVTLNSNEIRLIKE